MLLAMSGALLTSGPTSDTVLRGLGFFVWIFSNGYMLYHFMIDRNPPMILMFVFYEIFNIRGVYNSWF